MHHTWQPNHAQFNGHNSIVAMWNFHTRTNGWSDIAQHVTIDPEGGIWSGRHWDLPPASARGFNGNSQAGPFMFETVGDFDRGLDVLEGAQLESVIGVIASIQEKFQLPVEMLRFHNEMSGKTCPGTSIDKHAILEGVRQRRTQLPAEVMGRGPSQSPFSAEMRVIDGFLRSLAAPPPEVRDPADAEPFEGDAGNASLMATVAMLDTATEPGPGRDGSRFGARDALTPAFLSGLRPYLVNLNGGLLSGDGRFSTTPGDIDAIFQTHLKRELEASRARGERLRVVFYAHGGLVNEEAGLQIAANQIPWWRANGVYPIQFVWETGFGETLAQMLSSSRGARDIWDFTTDPAVETLARTLGGGKIWAGMKQSARQAVEPGGGAGYVAIRLAEFAGEAGDDVEFHAVGHSAGSIFHSHFIPAALGRGVREFKSLHFLAPAITAADFEATLFGLIGNKIGNLSIFTMAKDWELDDNVAAIYRKSLLYLIYYALEPIRETPILGLEVSLRADADLRARLGLDGTHRADAEVIWSKSTATTGRNASTSTTHGGFDNDPPTMNSVMRRILNVNEGVDITNFPTGTRGSDSPFTLPLLNLPALQPLFPAQPIPTLPIPTPPPPPSLSPAPIGPVPTSPPAGGRRRAICIGINVYPTAPLQGCVADARAWAEILRGRGFEITALLTDLQATRTAILDSLDNLIRTSRPGDVTVIQYAGHGTQLNDLDGDEDDAKDEAICPVDFNTGAFIVDDDLARIFGGIQDGMNVTCFFDCCHSGTNTRFAVGGSPGLASEDVRARYIVADDALQDLHRRYRQGMRDMPVDPRRDPDRMKQVVFAACRPEEVAYEVGSQGEFTRHAMELFARLDGRLSNRAFQQAAEAAFGATPRQHPHLDCAKVTLDMPFLEPIGPDSSGRSLSGGSNLMPPSGFDREALGRFFTELGRLMGS
jgi:hypothetical protein